MPMNSKPKNSACKVALALALIALIAIPVLATWKPGERLPDLGAAKLEGNLPALAGRVVLVDFWASWCGPCKKSFPELDKLQQELGGRGLTVLAVSVDNKASDMEKFLKEHPVAFATVRDAGQKLVAAAGVEAMPTSFLVDRKGVIRFTHAGFRGAETVQQLKQEIGQLLAEK